VHFSPGLTGDENDDVSDREMVLPLDRDRTRISNGIIEFLPMIVALVSSSRLRSVKGLVIYPRAFSLFG
jgi:hypothetical protein